MSSDRFICTAETPWTPDKGRAIHPSAKYIQDVDYGSGVNFAQYECPHCKLKFEVELAQ